MCVLVTYGSALESPPDRFILVQFVIICSAPSEFLRWENFRKVFPDSCCGERLTCRWPRWAGGEERGQRCAGHAGHWLQEQMGALVGARPAARQEPHGATTTHWPRLGDLGGGRAVRCDRGSYSGDMRFNTERADVPAAYQVLPPLL